ncbi:hypothetical protein [uncultured Tateyamaria sp.]|uniref:hypothetical protein n=1 Tax=uncultured Tateyamaria sp. TaxID=455651 RepID=UPI002616A02E|nr:hypothetical protein [uncultured Tateyamaria sp.]
MIFANETAYRFEKLNDQDTLLFSWKPAPGVDPALFRRAISGFARLCKEHRPSRGVIDAQDLDQSSSAFAWLRGSEEDQLESYDAWWAREVLPVYVQAKLDKLAVVTGDPSAPGEIPVPNNTAQFRMGYFHSLQDALSW